MFACLLTLVFYGAAGVLAWKKGPSLSSRLLAIGSLPAVWISICSVAGLLETLLGIPSLIWLVSSVVCAVTAAWKATRPANWQAGNHSGLPKWGLVPAAVCLTAIGVSCQRDNPWGSWDAMFTWVLRARFLLVGGDRWAEVFCDDLALLHPDYPPLLSWALTALWRVDRGMNSWAIAALMFPLWWAFGFFVLGFQAIGGNRVRLDWPTACLLATPMFWKLATAVLADFALAYGVLGSCAVYVYAVAHRDQRALIAAGLLAGWCGLLKNEGLTWCAAFLVVIAGTRLISSIDFVQRAVFRVVTGAALPIAAILLFKLLLAPPNDLVEPTRSFEIGEIVQPGVLIQPAPLLVRLDQAEALIYHRVIWGFALERLGDWKNWGVTLWLGLGWMAFRIRRTGFGTPLLLAIGLQAAVYYFVYLVTPYHPYWHISTTIDRLLTHLVPAGMCLLAFDATPQPIGGQTLDAVRQRPFLSAGLERAAISYLALVPLAITGNFFLERSQRPREPAVNLQELKEIDFPEETRASYVSWGLGTHDFYASQFVAAPTVLVIDRREPVLLARFSSEDELRRYCDRQRWTLESNRGGLGWARDNGGSGLEQPVKVEPLR